MYNSLLHRSLEYLILIGQLKLSYIMTTKLFNLMLSHLSHFNSN